MTWDPDHPLSVLMDVSSSYASDSINIVFVVFKLVTGVFGIQFPCGRTAGLFVLRTCLPKVHWIQVSRIMMSFTWDVWSRFARIFSAWCHSKFPQIFACNENRGISRLHLDRCPAGSSHTGFLSGLWLSFNFVYLRKLFINIYKWVKSPSLKAFAKLLWHPTMSGKPLSPGALEILEVVWELGCVLGELLTYRCCITIFSFYMIIMANYSEDKALVDCRPSH